MLQNKGGLFVAVGKKIKEARLARGVSQRELSEKLGVSPSMISMYEAGNRIPKYETLKRFADALGVNALSLFDDERGLEYWNDPDVLDAIAAAAKNNPKARPLTNEKFLDDVGIELFEKDMQKVTKAMDKLNHVGMMFLADYAYLLLKNRRLVIGEDGLYYSREMEKYLWSDSEGGADNG